MKYPFFLFLFLASLIAACCGGPGSKRMMPQRCEADCRIAEFIKTGMKNEEVLMILGQPDLIWGHGDSHFVELYERHGLVVSYDKDGIVTEVSSTPADRP